jgi:hypothetical protein
MAAPALWRCSQRLVPESVAGFRRLVAIAIIRRGATSTFKRPRFIKGLNRNFSSK